MTKFLSDTICRQFGLSSVPGLYGVEVEAELNETQTRYAQKVAEKFQKLEPYWAAKADNSLRGFGIEYVSRGPFADLETAKAKVSELYAFLDGMVNESMRAGVHVHMNVGSWTSKKVLTFLALYYALENTFFPVLGSERKGNLFCLDSEVANAIPFYLSNIVDNKTWGVNLVTNKDFRYSAMNLVSLGTFGSIEFRAMQTPTKADLILEWLEIIDNLRLLSFEFDSPAAVFNSFSGENMEAITSGVFKSEFAKTAILGQPYFSELVIDSIRNHQFWVYGGNW